MLLKTIITTVVAGAFAVALPTANDISYLDEATQALQSSVLYVSPSVSELSQDQKAELVSSIGSDSIAIVVLPANAKSEIDSIPSFISQLASRTDYKTILVSVGGDFEAGSSVLAAGKASQLANAAENANLNDGLVEFVSEAQGGQPSSGADALPLGGVIGITAVILGLVAVGTFGILLFKRAFSKGKSEARKQIKESRDTPKEIRDLLDSIARHLDGLQDASLKDRLIKANTHVHELFRRLHKRMPDTVLQTTGRYKGILRSVEQVVERYVDIQDHPLYFASSEKKAQPLLESGDRAISQYVEGVLQNIREIEAKLREQGKWNLARYVRMISMGSNPEVVREALTFGDYKVTKREIRERRQEIRTFVEGLHPATL